MTDRPDTPRRNGFVRFTAWFPVHDSTTVMVGGTGLLLLGLVLVHLVTSHLPTMATETNQYRLAIEWMELFFMLIPPSLLLFFGFKQRTRGTPDEGRWVMVRWILTGTLVVAGVILALRVHHLLLGLSTREPLLVMELLTGAGAGAVLGAVVGSSRLEGMRREATIEEQRNAFLFVNRVLRHNVLNGMNLIAGYTAKLESKSDPEVVQVQETVAERSSELTELIENVGAIVRTYTGTEPLEPVDLAEIVRAECERIRELCPAADLHLTVPDRAEVDATPLLPMVVRNLLENAVDHGASSGGPVTISVTRTADIVTLEISDRGEGIHEPSRYLGPGDSGDRGTGLYLADRALSQLDGSLSIEDNDPKGTVVTVELPTATDTEAPTGLTVDTLSLPSLWQ